jgi:hypothetical protein
MSYFSVAIATKNTLELTGRAREVSLVSRKGQEKNLHIRLDVYLSFFKDQA